MKKLPLIQFDSLQLKITFPATPFSNGRIGSNGGDRLPRSRQFASSVPYVKKGSEGPPAWGATPRALGFARKWI